MDNNNNFSSDKVSSVSVFAILIIFLQQMQKAEVEGKGRCERKHTSRCYYNFPGP